MWYFISFVAGAVLGGCFGTIMMALLMANKRADEMTKTNKN